MDNFLALTPALNRGEDIYVNSHPHWRPQWARGIYGGGLVAQSLRAAQQTVPRNFTAHSMHCSFVHAGAASDPVFYHVDRVRDGKQFVCRTVQARQRDRCIFLVTISFFSRSHNPRSMLAHCAPMPGNMSCPPKAVDSATLAKAGPAGPDRPFDAVRCPMPTRSDGPPVTHKLRQWIRARGPMEDDPAAHLAALAYMSDNYFIGTVARVHGARRFADEGYIDRMVDSIAGPSGEREALRGYLEELAREEAAENAIQGGEDARVHVGMMVSLDHSIFFHTSRGLQADQWMLAEMDSPWAGDERGLVTQRIWSRDGTLLATCIQEGIVRLTPEATDSPKL